MPIYRLEHTCGLKFDQFLKSDHTSVVMPCPRCQKNATWRQVRDKAMIIDEKDEVRGVSRYDNA